MVNEMLSHRALLRAHVETLFTQDRVGRLVRVNEPGGEPAPRFFLGRTPQGNEWWFRHDLSDDTRRRLEAACAAAAETMETEASPEQSASFAAILERAWPVRATWSGPAFVFPDHLAASPLSVAITRDNADLLRPHLASWREDVAPDRPLYAVLVDGEAVSVCASVRQSTLAHEAGVETAPSFRGNGYAAQAVSAWAAAVRRHSRLPLYSTSWTNIASLALARRLGLFQFASDMHLT